MRRQKIRLSACKTVAPRHGDIPVQVRIDIERKNPTRVGLSSQLGPPNI